MYNIFCTQLRLLEKRFSFGPATACRQVCWVPVGAQRAKNGEPIGNTAIFKTSGPGLTHASSEEGSPKYVLEPLHTLPLLVFEGGLIAVNWIYCILKYTHTHGYTHVLLSRVNP